jgi:thiol-disulfide isomerase/thioredoxin
MTRALIALTAVALSCLGLAAQDPQVQLATVNYDKLTEMVKLQKGKVVVVDFWADFCVPCKREFPNLVKMHQKYAADGLVAMSVALDDPTDEKAKARVVKFLQARQATFTNILLDEKPEVWQKQLDIDGPPCVYVFARSGQLEKKFTGEIKYGEIEELAVRLLKDK